MNNTLTVRIAGQITVETTVTGKDVASFRVAENKYFFNKKTGRKQKVTTFYTAKVWNGMAKSVEKNLRVGDLVKLKVNVKPNSWITKEGGELKEELVLTVQRYKFIRESRKAVNN